MTFDEFVKKYNFNSHAHVERDILGICQPQIGYNFNSHAHVERDGLATLSVAKLVNFNSHAHVERDVPFTASFDVCRISTHTLTWSVTPVAAPVARVSCISTHTLTWSVTRMIRYSRPL